MSERRTAWRRVASIWSLISLLCSTAVWAGKPLKPDDPPDDTLKYEVIELIGMSTPSDISNPLAGEVFVAGSSSEGIYEAAAYGYVDAQGDVEAGYLPEPRTPLPEGPWNELYGDVFNRASSAMAVNDIGIIVGSVDVFDENAERYEYGVRRACMWLPTEGGYVLQTLGVLPGHTSSSAQGVTNEGLIVGNSTFVDPDGILPAEGRAYIWDAVNGMRDLNILYPNEGWFLAKASAINETGWVVGQGWFQGEKRGYRLNIVTRQLDAVPLPPNGVQPTYPCGVNAQGRVVGEVQMSLLSDTASDIDHAFYWDGASEHAFDLGSVTDDDSHAQGINTANEVVGVSRFYYDDYPFVENVATYWAPDGAIVALETEVPSKPKWSFDFAIDVNDIGWIVAEGSRPYRNTSIRTAVILTPVVTQ